MCELRVSPRVVKGVDGGERMIYSEGEERKEKEDEKRSVCVGVAFYVRRNPTNWSY